jgi:hypothetical protein
MPATRSGEEVAMVWLRLHEVNGAEILINMSLVFEVRKHEAGSYLQTVASKSDGAPWPIIVKETPDQIVMMMQDRMDGMVFNSRRD